MSVGEWSIDLFHSVIPFFRTKAVDVQNKININAIEFLKLAKECARMQ